MLMLNVCLLNKFAQRNYTSRRFSSSFSDFCNQIFSRTSCKLSSEQSYMRYGCVSKDETSTTKKTAMRIPYLLLISSVYRE